MRICAAGVWDLWELECELDALEPRLSLRF